MSEVWWRMGNKILELNLFILALGTGVFFWLNLQAFCSRHWHNSLHLLMKKPSETSVAARIQDACESRPWLHLEISRLSSSWLIQTMTIFGLMSIDHKAIVTYIFFILDAESLTCTGMIHPLLLGLPAQGLQYKCRPSSAPMTEQPQLSV